MNITGRDLETVLGALRVSHAKLTIFLVSNTETGANQKTLDLLNALGELKQLTLRVEDELIKESESKTPPLDPQVERKRDKSSGKVREWTQEPLTDKTFKD